jgi:hypothetical protein
MGTEEYLCLPGQLHISPTEYSRLPQRNHAVMHGEVVLDGGVRCICMRCHLRDLHVPIEKKQKNLFPSCHRTEEAGQRERRGRQERSPTTKELNPTGDELIRFPLDSPTVFLKDAKFS